MICASGQRAAVGASLLARHGAREVIHVVDGGVGVWGRRAGREVIHVVDGGVAAGPAGWPLDGATG